MLRDRAGKRDKAALRALFVRMLPDTILRLVLVLTSHDDPSHKPALAILQGKILLVKSAFQAALSCLHMVGWNCCLVIVVARLSSNLPRFASQQAPAATTPAWAWTGT